LWPEKNDFLLERMAGGDHHIKVTIVTTNLSEYEKALQELENRNVVYGSHVSLTGSHEKGRCKISIDYQSKPTSP